MTTEKINIIVERKLVEVREQNHKRHVIDVMKDDYSDESDKIIGVCDLVKSWTE